MYQKIDVKLESITTIYHGKEDGEREGVVVPGN